MALVRTQVRGFYEDGVSEVSVIYDDVKHILDSVSITGNSDRILDLTIDGHRFRVSKNRSREVKINLLDKRIKFFIPLDDNTKLKIGDVPDIVATWHHPRINE